MNAEDLSDLSLVLVEPAMAESEIAGVGAAIPAPAPKETELKRRPPCQVVGGRRCRHLKQAQEPRKHNDNGYHNSGQRLQPIRHQEVRG